MDQAYKISKIIFELIIYTFVNYVVMKLRIILISMTLLIFVHVALHSSRKYPYPMEGIGNVRGVGSKDQGIPDKQEREREGARGKGTSVTFWGTLVTMKGHFCNCRALW